MTAYIIRRLLLMFPTLVGIITITFLIIQFVPGGPIDQMKSLLRGHSGILSEAGGGAQQGISAKRMYMDPQHLEQLRKIYHLDRPLWERYLRTFLWYTPQNLEGSPTDRFLNRNNWGKGGLILDNDLEQWSDYSFGTSLGFKVNKNLGVFIEGEYAKMWDSKLYQTTFGLNYTFR